jgi:tetratricopeptide (TPR) repeat protein
MIHPQSSPDGLPTDSSNSREIALNQLVQDCLRRQSTGEHLDVDAIIAAHPELLPELADELFRLKVIEAAWLNAEQTISQSEASTPSDLIPSPSGVLRILCPGCDVPIDIMAEISATQFTCEQCGLTFSLVDDSDSSEPEVKQIGHFELVEELGVGGFGKVWKAYDQKLARHVAIKLPRRRALTASAGDQFLKEARAAARLRHPNIVSIHEVGTIDGRVFIVSELVVGKSLETWLKQHRMSHSEAARFFVKMAAALEHAHQRGIIHRDVKPANILIDENLEPYITDFGLARWSGTEVAVSLSGEVIGMPNYMSPEQARGESNRADQRSDVYSLGVILFELLTGRVPFLGNPQMVLRKIDEEDPPSPRQLRDGVPRDLETICLKCLQKEPARRYQSAREFAEDVHRFLDGRPVSARRSTAWERSWRWCRRYPWTSGLAAALVIAVTLGAIVISWHSREGNRLRSKTLAAEEAAKLARKQSETQAAEQRQRAEKLEQAQSRIDAARISVQEQCLDDAMIAYTQAIELCPDLVTPWEERGQMYLSIFLTERAAADFQRAFELQPPTSDALPWYRHAILQFQVCDLDGYQQTCDRMLTTFQRAYESVTHISRVMCLSPKAPCDANQIIAMAQQSISPLHRNGPLIHILGIANYRAGRFRDAINVCRESISMDPNWAAHPRNFPILAMAHYRLNQLDESREAMRLANEAYDRWLTQCLVDPDDPRWPMHQGAIGKCPIDHLEFIEFGIYLREARTLLGLDPPQDYRIHLLRARAFAGLRLHKEALEEFEIALSINPSDRQIQLESHRTRAMYFVRQSKFQFAAVEFAKAVELSPNDGAIWWYLAIAHLAAQNDIAYRATCANMISRFSGTTDTWIAKNIAECTVCRPDAIADWSALIPIAVTGSQFSRDAPRFLAAAHYRAGNYSEAIRILQEVESVFQLRAFDLFFMAMAHHRLGQTAEASRRYAEAEAWIAEANENRPKRPIGPDPRWGAWTERPQTFVVQREARELLGK